VRAELGAGGCAHDWAAAWPERARELGVDDQLVDRHAADAIAGQAWVVRERDVVADGVDRAEVVLDHWVERQGVEQPNHGSDRQLRWDVLLPVAGLGAVTREASGEREGAADDVEVDRLAGTQG